MEDNTQIIVGLSGPSNSGKTTLLNSLSKELENSGYTVHTIEERVKDVFNSRWAYKYNTLYDIVQGNEYLDFQFDIFTQLKLDLIEAKHSGADIVITDRTFLDVLFYTITFSKHCDLRDEICSLCLENMVMYDLILNFERLDKIDNTGIRKSFIDLGKSYLGWENSFFSKVVPISVKYVQIRTKDLEERIFTCKNLIIGMYDYECRSQS